MRDEQSILKRYATLDEQWGRDADWRAAVHQTVGLWNRGSLICEISRASGFSRHAVIDHLVTARLRNMV